MPAHGGINEIKMEDVTAARLEIDVADDIDEVSLA